MQGFGILIAVLLLGVGLFLNTAVLLYFVIRCFRSMLHLRRGRDIRRLTLLLPRPTPARSV